MSDLTIDVDSLLQEIDLSFAPAQGRKSRETTIPLIVGKPRELSKEDVVVSYTQNPVGPTTAAPSLVRIRTRHHRLAQLLSTGLSQQKIALATGYSYSRVSTLQMDPAFRELVAHYSKENHAVDVEVRNRIEMLSLDSLEVLQDRLDESSEDFTNKELMELAEMTLDRVGYGKSSTVSVLHGLDDETIRLIQEQKDRETHGQILNLSEGEYIGYSNERPQRETVGQVLDGLDPLLPVASEKVASRIAEDQGDPGHQRRNIPAQSAGVYTDSAAEKWFNDRQGAGLPEKVDPIREGGNVIELRPSAPPGDESDGV